MTEHYSLPRIWDDEVIDFEKEDYKTLSRKYSNLPFHESIIIDKPIEFANKIGLRLFILFMQGLLASVKFQTYLDQMGLNANYQGNVVANKRNNFVILLDLISMIYEFKNVINFIHQEIYRLQTKYTTAFSSNHLIKIKEYQVDISKNDIIRKIRNGIGSHLGEIQDFKRGLMITGDEAEFIYGECTTDGYSFRGNNIMYNPADFVLKALDISNEAWTETLHQILELTAECIQSFELLFNNVINDSLASEHMFRRDSKK